MNHQNDLLRFDPLDHFNSPEDEQAVREIAQSTYGYSLLGDRGCNESPHWHGPVAVEIGAWAGRTTRTLAAIGFRVFAVDHWQGNPDDRLGDVAKRIGWQHAYQTFCSNMGPLLIQRVFPLFGSSMFWSSVWPDHIPIDLLYIDGDHRYEYSRRDIAAWSQHVRPGGIIAGHDYGAFEGITRAVEETGPFERQGKSVWWRRKNSG